MYVQKRQSIFTDQESADGGSITFEHFKTKIGCPVKFASFQKDSEQRIPNAWLVREYKAGFKIHEIGS